MTMLAIAGLLLMSTASVGYDSHAAKTELTDHVAFSINDTYYFEISANEFSPVIVVEDIVSLIDHSFTYKVDEASVSPAEKRVVIPMCRSPGYTRQKINRRYNREKITD